MTEFGVLKLLCFVENIVLTEGGRDAPKEAPVSAFCGIAKPLPITFQQSKTASTESLLNNASEKIVQNVLMHPDPVFQQIRKIWIPNPLKNLQTAKL